MKQTALSGRMRRATSVGLLLMAAYIGLGQGGCVTTNPYSQFYRDFTGGIGVAANPEVIPPTGEPRVIPGRNIQEDAKRMMEDGFAPIGESSFNGANASEWQAIQHARNIHAEVAILYQQQTETLSGAMPMTLPDTRSSSTTFSGNAFGSGGYANMYGSANTTETGTRTTYIPYQVRRYDFYASYWVKVRPRALGVRLRDLSEQERKATGSNKGAAVSVVIKQSPAFAADVMTGDIIRKVNDQEVVDGKQFGELLQQYRGQEVELTILRDGQTLSKKVKLNN